MQIRRQAPRFTYEDYLLMPEDRRYELIEGDIYMVPSPTTRHQRIAGRIYRRLTDFAEDRNLGEVLTAPLDVKFSQYDVVQPDLLFVTKERSNILRDRVEGAPDLLIEILSPDSRSRDLTLKRKLYFRHGVQEYWIVDPEGKAIEVLSPGQRDFRVAGIYRVGEILQSQLMPDLRIHLAEILVE